MIEKHEDERGWLAELVKDKDFGLVFVFVAKPGMTRGGHYHKRKHESFFVISGMARIILEHVETGERKVIEVSNDKIEEIKIEPLWSHAVKNIGDEDLYVISYVDELLDKKDPDSYSWKIDMEK